MATPPAKRKKRFGRPSTKDGKDVSIRLYKSTIQRWNEIKNGTECRTHNDFALFLMDFYTANSDQTRHEERMISSTPTGRRNSINLLQRFDVDENEKTIVSSAERLTDRSKSSAGQDMTVEYEETQTATEFLESSQCSSTSFAQKFSSFTGVYGQRLECSVSPLVDKSADKHIPLKYGNRTLQNSSLLACNPSFSTLEGDPPSSDDDDDDDDDDGNDQDSDDDSETYEDSCFDSDESDSIDMAVDEGLNSGKIETITKILQGNAENSDLVDEDIVTSFCTAKASASESAQSSSFMDLTSVEDHPIIASVEGNKDDIKQKLLKEFEELYSEIPEMPSLKENRYIVSLSKLLELKGSLCTEHSDTSVCLQKLTFKSEIRGCVLILRWSCPNKHFGKWESCEELCTKHNSKIYSIDMILASSILFSGNNYGKIDLLFDFAKIRMFSQTFYTSMQRLYCTPVINKLWDNMKEKIHTTLKPYSELCLCGDGRNDSPGHSAKYGVYVLMEHFTNIVVDLEVVDKRETKGVSVNMEKEGLRRLLLRLKEILKISELTTDASLTIQKLIADMKVEHEDLAEIFHSLDVWHKSKNLSKKLHAVAAMKGNDALRPWIAPIFNHFWHCAASCDGSPQVIKDKWLGVLHHVCGEHEWLHGKCDHGDFTRDDPREYLKKSDTCTDALRQVILDKKFLKALGYYVRSRHTGYLESFNGMLTKYTPKRNAFEYDYFIARTRLAAIDHNSHAFRPVAVNAAGEVMKHRKYSKRSKQFSVQTVKVAKTYPYISRLLTDVLILRMTDTETASRRQQLPDNHPKLISPTLALGVQPPETAELEKERLSRKK